MKHNKEIKILLILVLTSLFITEKEVSKEINKRTTYNCEIDESNSKIRNKISSNDLISIEENYDILKEIEESLYDYIEYEYAGMMKREYSSNPDVKNQTRRQRTVSHKFIGYKIEYIDNKLIVSESEPMDTIDELLNSGYEFVKYKKVYFSYDKETNKFIKYEDEMGPTKVESTTLKLKK